MMEDADVENYYNQALEDFPSDADIVSYQHTPKRFTETPYSNYSNNQGGLISPMDQHVGN